MVAILATFRKPNLEGPRISVSSFDPSLSEKPKLHRNKELPSRNCVKSAKFGGAVTRIGGRGAGVGRAVFTGLAQFLFLNFKGPLQYLVAMIRGYHARAIILPVGRKFFARFLASRRRFKSPTTFFYFVATNTKETFLFTFLIDFNFLFYVYNM